MSVRGNAAAEAAGAAGPETGDRIPLFAMGLASVRRGATRIEYRFGD